MLPDIVADNVTDACKRLSYLFVEQIFYHAAVDAGYRMMAQDKAHELHRLWLEGGYKAMPNWVKDFILRVNAGEVTKYEMR